MSKKKEEEEKPHTPHTHHHPHKPEAKPVKPEPPPEPVDLSVIPLLTPGDFARLLVHLQGSSNAMLRLVGKGLGLADKVDWSVFGPILAHVLLSHLDTEHPPMEINSQGDEVRRRDA